MVYRVRTPLMVLVWLTAGGAAPRPPDPEPFPPTVLPRGAYVLDKSQATLIARIATLGGLTGVTIRFNQLDGSFDYDPARWRSTRVTINVDPRSARSWFGQPVAGVLEADKYPQLGFVSHGFEPEDGGGRARLTGDLTLHGVTRPVTLEVKLKGLGAAGGAARASFSGVGQIRRSDFHLRSPDPFAANTVDLAFDVNFVRAGG